MIKTAIVILNYNGKSFLERFLPRVVALSAAPDVAIIVADNASTDDSVAFLREQFPNEQPIILPENFGFAGGYNHALAQVKAEYYILLNSDIEVTANWIQPLINYLDSHPNTAACQPKIKAFYDRKRFEHAGAAGGYIDQLGYPFCRGRIMNITEIDQGQYDQTVEVFWATGACLAIRSADFWAAGGFDERFFAHQEEIDLCWRLRSRGRSIVCVPQSVVYHVGGGTLNYDSPRKVYLNFRNNLLMLYKNLPEKLLKNILLLRMILDGVAAIQFLLTGKFSYVRSVWQAHRDFRKMLPDFAEKRKENLAKQTASYPLIGMTKKSLLIEFFIKRHRKFSEVYS
ncbi:MAG: glycosyltransferase family 2 protein [Prevotellaceae bacterium]|nr:glycosyltransferase family 2 protein [Prevotellaceae bacterium]